jgi:hypothetical protein
MWLALAQFPAVHLKISHKVGSHRSKMGKLMYDDIIDEVISRQLKSMLFFMVQEPQRYRQSMGFSHPISFHK